MGAPLVLPRGRGGGTRRSSHAGLSIPQAPGILFPEAAGRAGSDSTVGRKPAGCGGPGGRGRGLSRRPRLTLRLAGQRQGRPSGRRGRPEGGPAPSGPSGLQRDQSPPTPPRPRSPEAWLTWCACGSTSARTVSQHPVTGREAGRNREPSASDNEGGDAPGAQPRQPARTAAHAAPPRAGRSRGGAAYLARADWSRRDGGVA